MFIDLVTLGAFAVFCLLVFLIGDTIAGGRRTARLLADGTAAPASRSPNAFTRALAGIIPQSSGEVEAIRRDLSRAGYYRPSALLEYMATRNALVVGILIAAGFLAVVANPGTRMPEVFLFAGVMTAALGYALPRMMVHWQAARRVDRIERGLPDALDIVRMCLAGGLPLRSALERVSEEIALFHPDIAVEFEIIRRHADADTMAGALRQFAARIDSPDVNALAALVAQSDRLGTHAGLAVTEYADSVRLAARQRAQERASKTSIRLLFPVILCLAPPIYILLMGPPILQLRNFIIEGHRPGGVLEPLSNAAQLADPQGSAGRTGDRGRATPVPE